jgi:hypothetical protein
MEGDSQSDIDDKKLLPLPENKPPVPQTSNP